MAAIIAQRLLQTGLLVVVVAALLVSRFMTGSIRSLMSAVHAVAAGGEYEPGNERVTEFVRLLKYWQFSHLVTHLNSSLPTE